MALSSIFVAPALSVFGATPPRVDPGTELFRKTPATGKGGGLISARDVQAAGGKNFQDPIGDPRNTLGDTKIRARRPLRGVQIKEDTYCSLRIITELGAPILQIDASGSEEDVEFGPNPNIGKSFLNTNFIAQTIQEERVEKAQILETFGEPFVFFFGERPRFIHVSGFLLNTVDFNWRAEWWENYDQRLRGSKLVEQRAKVFLTWDDVAVEGYILNATAQDLATEPYRLPFTFSVFLTKYINVGIRGEIPTGTRNPIERLKKNVQSEIGKRSGSFFSKIFSPVNQDRVNLVLGGALDVVDNPVRASLAIIQGAQAAAVRQGIGAVENALKTPEEKAALRRIKGLARTDENRFGPLSENFDEFLNTQIDKLDIPTLRTRGLDSNNFLQRLINLAPGLNNPRTLNRLLNTMKTNHSAFSSFSSANPLTGTSLISAENFLGGSSSSPFLDKNIQRQFQGS